MIMPTMHMTEASLRKLIAPAAPQQISYFDDPTKKGGVRGLLLIHSYGSAMTFYCMWYQNGKSKLYKLGRFPILTLEAARQAALDFQRDPDAHLVKKTQPETFAKVSADFLREHVRASKLRSARVTAPTTTLDEALHDPNLFGAALGNIDSWSMWLAVLRASQGMPLNQHDRDLFASVAGNRALPEHRVSELWAIIGRRSGKSRVAAAIADHVALLQKHTLALLWQIWLKAA
jgi:hypothetical protein